jgi:hypothetical protein
MLYSGIDGSIYRTYAGHAVGEGIGYSMSGLGDVDGDSIPDYAIGGWQPGGGHLGRVDVYSGEDGHIIHTYVGNELNGGFAGHVSGHGDLDGDQVNDLVVGAYHKDSPPTDAGCIYLYSPGDPDDDGFTGTADNCPARYNPNQEDYDGDGFGDLCDACPAHDTPGGEAIITGDVNVSGTLTTGDIIHLVNYIFKGGDSPLPIDAAGDVNCDDLVIASDIIYLVNHVLKGGTEPCDVCALGP